MAVPAPLSRKLRETLGPEAGEILVTWLEEMRAENEQLRASIHADFARFRQEMLSDIRASEARLVDRIHGVETRLGDRIGDVKADLMKWSFVFWVGAVTAIATLAGVFRR